MISRFLPSSFVVAVLLLVGCAGESTRSSAPPDETESESRAGSKMAIDATLDGFHRAAAAADLESYLGAFADEGVFLGTDATERWTVAQFRAFCEPYFSKGTGWKYEPIERHVVLAPTLDVAWFDERLWNEKYGETRGTGVLRRVDGAWKIAQYNLTFTIPNDIAKDVVDLVRKRD